VQDKKSFNSKNICPNSFISIIEFARLRIIVENALIVASVHGKLFNDKRFLNIFVMVVLVNVWKWPS